MYNILDYGYDETMLSGNINGTPARITAVYKERYEIVSQYGISYAKLKSSIYYNNCSDEFPTTGDFVIIQYNKNGDSLIIKTLERKSKFSRTDFSGHLMEYVKTILEQVVAVNFDYVFIMASLNNDFNIRRIERYITLSLQSKALPIVILTKSDLVEDFSEQIKAVKEIAKNIEVYAVSAKTGYGIDALSLYLQPRKTIVFLGSSGVGKSSFVNALAKEEIMKVNDIREDDSKGRHTTTHRQLIMLHNGVMIIDTPGMRELGMWDVNDGLSEAFNDVEDFLGKCKFSDCKHNNEPGCAIRIAIEEGKLSEKRWKSYISLKKEVKFSNNKSSLNKKNTKSVKKEKNSKK